MLLNDNQEWHIHHGDCISHMAEMPAASVDFSVFSPPFPSLYAYTSEMCDIGNSDEPERESKLHLSFFYRQLARVLKPGRVAIVHVMQIPRLLRNNSRGTCDFRGMNIRLGERAGLVYEYDWLVAKNPQAQAIRTHSYALLFVTLERDRATTRGALADYLIKFTAPGENTIPIDSAGQISRKDWIDWAEAAWPWRQIRETDTLNAKEGRGPDDTKHICPLQLGVITRTVKLFSNPGEIVFSPFAGIGSEGYIAIKLHRRFYGCEIKDEYLLAAQRNMERALRERRESERTLFDLAEDYAKEHDPTVTL